MGILARRGGHCGSHDQPTTILQLPLPPPNAPWSPQQMLTMFESGMPDTTSPGTGLAL